MRPRKWSCDMSQERIDSILRAHAEGEQICQGVLRDVARGRQLRADALPVADRDFVLGSHWSDSRVNPNDAALERLARMFVQDSAECAASGWRADAGETRLFATMLKHVVARLVPTLYIPNKVRSTFPIDASIPPGAKTFAIRRIVDRDDDDLGILTSKSDDIIEVEIDGEEDVFNLLAFARAFSWSMDELEAAAFAGVPLQTEKLAALNRAAERIFELVSLQGVPERGIIGLYNDGNIPPTGVVTGNWVTATHDQIVGDCRALIEGIYTATYMRPNRLVVPSESWRYLSVRRTETDLNVLAALQQDYPGLSIVEASPRADTYDAAGTGPRMMAFTYSPDMVKVLEPRRFSLEMPERHGFNYRVAGRSKLGGAAISMPLTVGYMDGI
jgi:hypothetical protein